ncbi:hypothetical protein D020_4308B, partial [Vibrio parahaemolyticus SBR10290]
SHPIRAQQTQVNSVRLILQPHFVPLGL